MELSEIEILVNELETRVDRLRSLYDQYFMGIERMPPAVPHKDVERRVQILRREQIRNTGIRYRFQMILQRYNTYQSYWLRISRQIEDGTYKRDVIRAKRKAAEREVKESLAPASIDITHDLDELEEVPDDEAPTVAKAEHVELKLDEIDSLDALLDDEKPTKLRPVVPAAKPAAKPPKPPPPKAAVPVPPPSAPAVVARPVALPSAGGARPQWKKVSAPTAGVSIPIAEPAKQGPLPSKPDPKPDPKPEPEKPEKPAAAAAAKPKPARPEPPKPRAPLGPDDLSDARVRQIYAEYVRTKRSQNESTASLNYESMAKSIRDSSEKLREKHGGQKVDFEVQVKDGKTILKPVVKKT